MRLLAFLGLLLFCVPSHAEQFAVITKGQESIELHDRVHGLCPQGLNEAIYRNGVIVIRGCWKVQDRHVLMVFEDGDAIGLSIELFTWVRGKKPATM